MTSVKIDEFQSVVMGSTAERSLQEGGHQHHVRHLPNFQEEMSGFATCARDAACASGGRHSATLSPLTVEPVPATACGRREASTMKRQDPAALL